MMKVTKEQSETIKKYASENDMTVEQVINYVVTILEQEMEN